MEKVARGFFQLDREQRLRCNDMPSVLQQPAAPQVNGQAADAAEVEERSSSEAKERSMSEAEELARKAAEERRARVCQPIIYAPQT